MKILFAVDGSPSTGRMLAYVSDAPELLGTGHLYTALTIVPAVPGHAASWVDAETLQGWYAEQAESVLASVRAIAEQQGWELQTRHAAGHAGELIARIAQDEHFDLVVMGTHGHSALANVVLGSVVTRVLALSRVPVLLIH